MTRLRPESALRFLHDSGKFRIHWIASEDHREAMRLLANRRKRNLSLVDCASFVVMQSYRVKEALAFDGDFAEEGFSLYQQSGETGTGG